MKKLLLLALIAPVALANAETQEKTTGQAIKDAVKAPFIYVADTSKKVATKVKDVAHDIKNSEAAQDIADVAGQFAELPSLIGDGFNVGVDATKTLGRKIADIQFVEKAKDAGNAIVDGTKKAATKVKDVATDVVHSEAAEDTKDVLKQFASVPLEAWSSIKSLFTKTTESTTIQAA